MQIYKKLTPNCHSKQFVIPKEWITEWERLNGQELKTVLLDITDKIIVTPIKE